MLHIGLGIGGLMGPNSDIAVHVRANDLQESLHARLSQVTTELTGLDVDATIIEAMQAKVPGHYIVGDIADPGLPETVKTRFDTILFLEVLQDVGNPRQALLNVKDMLNDEGELILSACNAYCLDRIAKMVFGYEAVYPEHLCYFSYKTMKRMLHITGFEVESVYYTHVPRNRGGRIAGRVAYPIELAICRILPQFAEGILMVARPHR